MICRSSASSASRRSGSTGALASVTTPSISVLITCSFNPSDIRPARAQLLLQTLEPAIQMINPADRRLALGDQAGDDQAHGGPQVGGHHLGAVQPLDPFDLGLARVHPD